MYRALQRSFAKARIGWGKCATEDRGNGVLVLLSLTVPKSSLVTRCRCSWPTRWPATTRHAPGEARIRLRMALHAGEVLPDAHGSAGTSINRAFRPDRGARPEPALQHSPGVLALIVSDWFYHEVVRHHRAARPSAFRQVRAAVQGNRHHRLGARTDRYGRLPARPAGDG